jgi:hypothetical protein
LVADEGRAGDLDRFGAQWQLVEDGRVVKNGNAKLKSTASGQPVSSDGKQWGSAVSEGRFPNNDRLRTVRFEKPMTGRGIRLVALSEWSGQYYTTLAELDVMAARQADAPPQSRREQTGFRLDGIRSTPRKKEAPEVVPGPFDSLPTSFP